MFTWFKNLKIKYKLLTLAFTIMVTSLTGIMIVVIYSFKYYGQEYIDNYKTEEINRVKQSLKNYIDIAYKIIQTNYYKSQNGEYQKQYYKTELKAIINYTTTFINHKIKLVNEGKISLNKAQSQVKEILRNFRYKSGAGYLWIISTDKPYSKIIMHPILSNLEGKIMDDPRYDNAAIYPRGNLFKVFHQIVDEKGEGLVYYKWPDIIDKVTLKSKIAYIKKIKEWNWIIGIGLYTDLIIKDFTNVLQQETIDQIRQMRFGENNKGYFWINDTAYPYPKMIMHPINSELEGGIMNRKDFYSYNAEYTDEYEKNMNFFTAMVDICLKKNHGFIDYLWSKPSSDTYEAKLSYVRLFEPWGWIIGTGEYIDNISLTIAKKTKSIQQKINKLVLYLLVVISIFAIILFLIIFYIASIVNKTTNKVLHVFNRMSEGDLSKTIDIDSKDEIGQLSKNFNKMSQNLSNSFKKLEESENRFRSLIEKLPVLVHAHDANWNFIYWNNESERITGYTSQEIVNNYRARELLFPNKSIYDINPHKNIYNESTFETEIIAKNGNVKIIEWTNRSNEFPIEGWHSWDVGIDVTEKRIAEMEKENLIYQLTNKNAELENFTYTVSHDLRSPLVTIKGFLGYLKMDIENGNSKRIDQDFHRISNATDKMGQLLEDLLELSKIGRMVNPSEMISMNDLINDVQEMLSHDINARNVKIIVEENLPNIYGDKVRLVQVFQNIFENAIKYMGDQKFPIIEIGTIHVNSENTIFIKDNGIGIPKQYHEKIFGLFQKLDEKVQGNGIGLALVKRIIEFHHGKIWVESIEGEGSTFIFTIPDNIEVVPS